MEITEQSYLDLLDKDQQVWIEDGRYFTTDRLIKEDYKDLIVEEPSYLIYNFIKNNKSLPTEWPGYIIFPEQLDVHPPKKSYIAFGERVKTLYFTDDTYSTSFIKVEYIFDRDEKGYLLKKTRTISWKKSDGEWCPNTKVLVIPISSENERQKEIKIRRSNIIDGLKGLAAEMNITYKILELFKKYQLEEDLYVESGSNALYEAIKNDTITTWLDEPLPNGWNAREALLLHLQHGIASYN